MKIPGFVWVIGTLLIGGLFLFVLVSNKNKQIYENIKLPIEITEYFDYNCSHCANLEEYIKDIKSTYGDKVKFTKKYYPLNELFGETSFIHAQAAEAAKKQNKFQEYTDILFKWNWYFKDPNNTYFEYTDDEKVKYAQALDYDLIAKDLGLDVEQFKKDRASDEVKNTIIASKVEGSKSGVSGTPTVLIFGQKFDLNDDLKAKIGELISVAEKK